MDTVVKQLENNDCQRKAILSLFLFSGYLPDALKLRRQVIRRKLPGRETFTDALDAKAIAVQQRDIEAVTIKPQVDRLHVDHPVLPSVQRGYQGCEVTGQAHFCADAFRQILRLRLPRL